MANQNNEAEVTTHLYLDDNLICEDDSSYKSEVRAMLVDILFHNTDKEYEITAGGGDDDSVHAITMKTLK